MEKNVIRFQSDFFLYPFILCDMNNITAAKKVSTVRRLQVFLTVVGCDIQALRGVYMIGCGFSLMIPRAEAARNTDDLRTTTTPGNGAEDGGWEQRDSKAMKGMSCNAKDVK